MRRKSKAKKGDKLILVEQIVNYGNKQLEREDSEATQSYKAGICSMIEKVLLDSGNYSGFQYLDWINGGLAVWELAGKPEGPDKDGFMYGKTGRYSRRYILPYEVR